MAQFIVTKRGWETWDYDYLVEAPTRVEAEELVRTGEGGVFLKGRYDDAHGETTVLSDETRLITEEEACELRKKYT